MKKGLFIQILLAALLLPVFSCSDDDGLPELNNVTTLNMLDTNNGATYLGEKQLTIYARKGTSYTRIYLNLIGKEA